MLQRTADNPILTRTAIPDVPPMVHDVSSVFNPGAIELHGRTYLVLRVQTRGRETVLMVAESADGVHFTVRPKVIEIEGIEHIGEAIYHIYDPRLTQIDDTVYMTFAADVEGACRLGIARTRDMSDGGLFLFVDVNPGLGVGARVKVQAQDMSGEAPVVEATVVRVEASGVALMYEGD